MEYEKTVIVNAPIDKVFDFCASPFGFEKHFPYKVCWLDKQKKWDLGSVVEFKFCYFLIWIYWKSEITTYEKYVLFVDLMKVGFPFKYFKHHHYFTSQNKNTVYRDKIEFSLGYGSFIDKTLGTMIVNLIFTKRQQNLQEYWENYYNN